MHFIKLANYDDEGSRASLLALFILFHFDEHRIANASYICKQASLIVFPLVDGLNRWFELRVLHHILMSGKQDTWHSKRS